MQFFSADAMLFPKTKTNGPKNMTKLPSKVANNRPQPFFSVLAQLPKQPKNKNPVPPKVPGYLDWVQNEYLTKQ